MSGTKVGGVLEKIKLTDSDAVSYEIVPLGGAQNIQEIPITDESVQFGGVPKYGQPTPQFSFQEQDTWSGGRAQEDFRDPSRFYDASAFTMLPQEVRNAIQWKAGRGLRDADQTLPGSVKAKALAGVTQRWYSSPFTPDTSYSVKYVYIWVKREESLDDTTSLTAFVYDDSAGNPNTSQGSSAALILLDSSHLPILSQWKLLKFTFSSAVAVTATTAYHIVLKLTVGAAGNNVEIGVDASTTNSQESPNGSAWDPSKETMYFYATDADVGRKFHTFVLQEALYAVSIDDDQSAGNLYINGDRGIATGGSSTTLTDTFSGTYASGGWVADQWIGAYVRIIGGTGKHQKPQAITDSTTTSITVASWDVTPDNTSEYVIYRTPYWNELTSTGIGVISSFPIVVGSTAYFPKGSGNAIRRMRYLSTATGTQFHEWEDDAALAQADLLLWSNVNGGKVWGMQASTGTMAYSDKKDWGTDLSIDVLAEDTDEADKFTNAIEFDNKIYAFTPKAIYTVDDALTITEADIGLRSMPSSLNGRVAAVSTPYLYFNWLNTVQQLLGSQVQSIDPNKDAGLPDNRRGTPSAIVSHPAGIFVAIDAGASGFSSVLFWDQRSWHEVFRAPVSGQRVRGLTWQGNDDTNPILWIDYNGEMLYQLWPKDTISPRQDSALEYQHQSHHILSTFDGNKTTIEKAFKSLTAISENLQGDDITPDLQYIDVYYQADNNIGSSSWTQAWSITTGYFNTSPREKMEFSVSTLAALEDVNTVRFLLSFNTANNTRPAILKAISLAGFGRTQIAKQWSIQTTLNNFVQQGVDAEDVVAWLDTVASSPKGVLVECEYQPLDGKTVRVWTQQIMPGYVDQAFDLQTAEVILILTAI